MSNTIKNDLTFRDLTPEDVEVRVAMAKANGVSLLVYKDARVDQDILDETVGKYNWRKKYEVINDNLYCTISIKDPIANEWIDKMDCGVESNTEKEKGEASDAQKRAGFVWGIGRELYTVPFVWVSSDKCEIVQNDRGGYQCKTTFSVNHMKVENKKITELQITNNKTGEVVWSMNNVIKTSTVEVEATNTVKKTETKPATTASKSVTTTTKKPSLTDALKATYKNKTGKTLSLQQTIDACKTESAKTKFLEWLKEQANKKTEIAEQCKIVYIAATKNLVTFPIAA